MKLKKVFILLLSAALLSGSVLSHGAPVYRAETDAMAGASFLLGQYLESSEDAMMTLVYKLEVLSRFFGDSTRSNETLEPVTYPEPKTGYVCVESSLNIRDKESVVSEAKVYAKPQHAITVLGEHLVQGKLWYYVDYQGVKGYASADYIKFGNEAIEYFSGLGVEFRNHSLSPTAMSILDDVSGMPASALQTIQDAIAKNINYCLRVEYPKYWDATETNEYYNMISVMEHILRNYQTVLNVCTVYNLANTHARASADMTRIGYLLENVTVATGITSKQVQEQAEKTAAQMRAKRVLTIGEQIAQYASTFVNILPYIWGGASLTRGADCSGFCGQIYAHFGYLNQAQANAHYFDSRSLRNVGREVSLAEIQPGDMVCYEGHVAIYYGNNTIVHEPSRGKLCSYGTLYWAPILTARRLVPE